MTTEADHGIGLKGNNAAAVDARELDLLTRVGDDEPVTEGRAENRG